MRADVQYLRSEMSRKNPDIIAVVLLGACWLAAALFIDLRGPFYLNDDWAYAYMVERFFETGHYQSNSWTYVPAVSHAWLGTAFSAVFGFSPTVLRCSVAFAGWLGMVGMYVLGRSFELPPRTGVFLALLLGFNPIYFCLAFTFMTDVPFAAAFVWAFVGIVRFAQRRSVASLGLALGSALFATLCRQPALVLFPALGGALLLARIRSGRSAVAVFVASVAFVAALIGFLEWVVPDGRFGIVAVLYAALGNDDVLTHVKMQGTIAVIYLGIFSIPLMADGLVSERLEPRWYALAGFCATIWSVIAWRSGRQPPFGKNILHQGGLGPVTAHGFADRPVLPSWFWGLVATAGAIAAGILLARLARHAFRTGWRGFAKDTALVTALLATIAYVLPTSTRATMFDRYFLVLIPAALIVWRQTNRQAPIGGKLGWAALVSGALFSIAATRDYFDHQRARQTLIDHAFSAGARAEEIEGGFEFDGAYNFALHRGTSEDDVASFHARAHAIATEPPGSWSYPDRYLVSGSPRVAGYSVVQSQSFRRWVPWGTETLFLHQRPAPEAVR